MEGKLFSIKFWGGYPQVYLQYCLFNVLVNFFDQKIIFVLSEHIMFFTFMPLTPINKNNYF